MSNCIENFNSCPTKKNNHSKVLSNKLVIYFVLAPLVSSKPVHLCILYDWYVKPAIIVYVGYMTRKFDVSFHAVIRALQKKKKKKMISLL